jgi:1-acyl-sn-glycerol-3-phosphate acyltransferase
MIAAAVMAAGVRIGCGIVTQWRCDPETTSQRIYFANHSSHLDFVVIWSALSPRLRTLARPVAGRDYWERDSVRRYLARDMFRAVLVDRSPATVDPCASARAAVERMADAMGDRDSLILFPEGTRSTTGEVGPFKSGIYHLSKLRPDAELIPVHVENLNRILPKGEVLPVPMISRVVFGPPVMPASEGKQDFLNAARDALLHLGRSL